jgi:HD-like signal output (HDOD) protein
MTQTTPSRVETLIEEASALPCLPGVVQQLIESFEDERISIEEIAEIIAADPVLSAKLLRLANSAYYHVSREIGTVPDAMAMLGFVTVRTLVISSGLTGGFKRLRGLDQPQFWRNSLKVACLARHWAKMAGLNRELAFTVGMMHRIGELLMYMIMAKDMEAVDRDSGMCDMGRAQVERRTLGFSYAEVGGALAAHWRFPDAFASAVRRATEPLAEQPRDPMACLLYLAVWRVSAEEQGLSEEAIVANWPDAVGTALNFSRDAALLDLPPLSELAAGMEELIR